MGRTPVPRPRAGDREGSAATYAYLHSPGRGPGHLQPRLVASKVTPVATRFGIPFPTVDGS